MARAIRKWHTPDAYEADTVCRPLALPHWSLLPFIGGALSELTKAHNWEQVGTLTPEQMAEIFTEVLNQWEGECGMDCNEMLACLNSQQTRINPTTGEYERSTDGGATWEPAPELDPRTNSAPYEPVEAQCPSALAIVGFAQRWMSEQTDVLDIASTVFAVAGVLASLAALVFTGGLAMPLLISAATVAVTHGGAAITAALTATVWEDFRCIVACAIGDAETITQEIFDAIVDAVDAEFTLTAHAMLSSFLQTMGPVGLQNGAAFRLPASGIAADCDDCDCIPAGPCDHTIDFTVPAEYVIDIGTFDPATTPPKPAVYGLENYGVPGQPFGARVQCTFPLPEACMVNRLQWTTYQNIPGASGGQGYEVKGFLAGVEVLSVSGTVNIPFNTWTTPAAITLTETEVDELQLTLRFVTGIDNNHYVYMTDVHIFHS